MAEPLGCILYITGFLIYWYSSQRLSSSSSSVTNTSTNTSGNSSNTQYRMLTFILTLVEIALWTFAMVLSVLTKETGVTLAGVVVSTATAYLLERIGYTLLITDTTDSATVKSGYTSASASVSASLFLARLRAIPSLFTHRKWIIDCSSGQLLWIVCALLSVVGYTFMRMITATYDIVELFSEIKKTPYGNWSITNIINWVYALLQQHQGSIGGSLYLGKSELIRKAENPFAFLTGTERMFSIAYLHFRYMFVMIYPKDLSAEYAFDCISKVSDIHDVRNIYTLMTYGSLLIGFGIGLVCVLFPRIQSSKYITLNPTAILIALIGLVVPFLPASGVSEVKSSCCCRSSTYINSVTNDIYTMAVVVVAEPVFLRLGTLLAERLLYISSIGFCMLLSIILFKLCVLLIWICGGYRSTKTSTSTTTSTTTNDNDVSAVVELPSDDSSKNKKKKVNFSASVIQHRKLQSQTQSKNKTKSKTKESSGSGSEALSIDSSELSMRCLYFIIVLVIVSLYSWKTIDRNPAWKNDTTLFLDSYKVCPRSAKLNLQIAKIRLNEGNATAARRHVNNAAKIDPDFCDVGYQDAILKVIHEGDVEGGLEVAANNLRCIYT
eukprot:gene10329-21554_t